MCGVSSCDCVCVRRWRLVDNSSSQRTIKSIDGCSGIAQPVHVRPCVHYFGFFWYKSEIQIANLLIVLYSCVFDLRQIKYKNLFHTECHETTFRLRETNARGMLGGGGMKFD